MTDLQYCIGSEAPRLHTLGETTVYGLGDSSPLGLDYVIDLQADRPMRILQITDPQIIDSAQRRSPDRISQDKIDLWATENIAANVLYYIDGCVKQARPDLILITGDLVYGEFDDSGTSLELFVRYMESLQIPWAPVFGNHDNESKKGIRWQCEQLMNAENCLFRRRHELGGNGNYSIGLCQNGELRRMVFMLDSKSCMPTGDPDQTQPTGPGFTDAQKAWYRDTAARVNVHAGRTVPSFVCWHVPTQDILAAVVGAGYQEWRDGNDLTYTIGVDVPACEGDSGRKGEEFKTMFTDTEPTLQSYMKEVGGDGAFFGHSHLNSISVAFDGIRWTFGLKTGKCDRCPRKMGGTEIVLSSDWQAFFVRHVIVE